MHGGVHAQLAAVSPCWSSGLLPPGMMRASTLLSCSFVRTSTASTLGSRRRVAMCSLKEPCSARTPTLTRRASVAWPSVSAGAACAIADASAASDRDAGRVFFSALSSRPLTDGQIHEQANRKVLCCYDVSQVPCRRPNVQLRAACPPLEGVDVSGPILRSVSSPFNGTCTLSRLAKVLCV